MTAPLSPWKLRQAVHSFRRGEVIAYPTEAVFGLGCDPLNPDAVFRILEIKQRPVEKGLILIAADFDQLRPFITLLDDEQMQPVLESWPGPNTWLLPKAEGLPFWLCGEHDTLAVRVTGHPVAAALCRACNSPLVSTSANISRQRPARSALEIRLRLDRMVDCIINRPVGENRQPSSIRDAASGRVLRG
jgi:L-threonylcarbamoyladenylate synthase